MSVDAVRSVSNCLCPVLMSISGESFVWLELIVYWLPSDTKHYFYLVVGHTFLILTWMEDTGFFIFNHILYIYI